MTKKTFDEKFAAVSTDDLADAMADNFTALVDGDKALFEVKKKDGSLSVYATVENMNDIDYRAEMSFERFAYSRERYIRTYLPKAIRHAVAELIGTSVKAKVTTTADLWSLSSLDESENGLTYNVTITPIESRGAKGPNDEDDDIPPAADTDKSDVVAA